jgi:hypothetical protein
MSTISVSAETGAEQAQRKQVNAVTSHPADTGT